MRWELVKAAWGLAAEAFPKKRVYVVVPSRVAPEGAMEVIGLEDGKEAGKIAYRVTPSGRVTLSARNCSTRSKWVAMAIRAALPSPRRMASVISRCTSMERRGA